MTKQQLNRPATVVGADHNFSVHIDAAPELVFEAWKNPIQLSQWWAPGNFVTSVAEWDVRPGGNIRIYVKAADGNEHLHQGKFLEVLFPEKLVLVLQKDGPGLDKQHDHTLVVNIAEETGSTRITVQHEAKDFVETPDSWNQSLLRLKRVVETINNTEPGAGIIPDADREIRSTRTFKASRELVFSLWTNADHLSKWWGPTGFTITTAAFDFKPNGLWDFIMHGPDGVDYRNKIRYNHIKAPERIEYEHITGPVHRVIVLFEEKDAEQTIVHFRMIFANSALRNKVASQFGAVEGLEQTLNRLQELLASQ